MAENEKQGKLADKLSSLGHTLYARWTSEARPQRQDTEERWIRDIYQYRSEYTPDELSRMPENGSKVYPPATRKKVTIIAARLRDMLFPPAHDRNWTLNSTPEPVLPPQDEQALRMEIAKQRQQRAMEQMQQQVQQAQQQAQQGMQQTGGQPDGMPPGGGQRGAPGQSMMGQGQRMQPPGINELMPGDDDEELQAARRQMAEDRAERMRTRIDDQLTETRYSEIVGGDVIRSACIYGTGILKGPMVDEQEEPRFSVDENGAWVQEQKSVLKPYIEHVSVWDIYPDMAARDWDDVRYIYQRHTMPSHDLIALAERDDFDGETIIEYLRSAPDGDRVDQNHEAELRTLGERDSVTGSQGRYEVLEYWGVVDPEDLAEYDAEAEGEVTELWANVWMLGQYVIKAVISPAPGRRKHPYQAFNFDEDETSIWGLGVPVLMRDDQAMTCAATRAMLDNAAIASGPILEVNTQLLAPGEDASDIYPRRMFYRKGVGQDAQHQAIREVPVSSHINEYLSLIELSDQWTHEHTVPSYMEGQPTRNGGAQGTAQGLSMLMGAANVEIKSLARAFDDGITRPFIEAMYHWNMLYGDDEAAKGDYEVVARGSASLVQKEIRAQRLDQFASQATGLPDANKVDWDELLRRRLEAHDLPDDLLLDDEEAKKRANQPDPKVEMEKAKLEIEKEKLALERERLQMEREKVQAEAAKIAAETQTEQAEAGKTSAEAQTEQAEAAKTAAEAQNEALEVAREARDLAMQGGPMVGGDR
ncbi:MAG: hypothetical protein ACOCUJ_01555 [Thiohalospira sp.]